MFALRSKPQGIGDICIAAHCLHLLSVMRHGENLDEVEQLNKKSALTVFRMTAAYKQNPCICV